METIFTRRSVRKYADKAVEAEKVEALLRAAMQAPSAGNQQPWEFIVVNDKAVLTEMAAMSPYAQMLAGAPLAIVLVANTGILQYPEYWQQDLAAATQNLLLEVVEQGLGAVWLGVAPLPDRSQFIRNLLQLPLYIQPFAVVPVGYPLQANKRVDRYQAAKVHYGSYTEKI